MEGAMKKTKQLLILAMMLFTGKAWAGPEDLPSFASTAKAIKPSVVNISTEKEMRIGRALGFPGGEDGQGFDDFFDRFFGGGGGMPGQKYKQSSLGSGFIVDAVAGLVLTNNHVVEKADSIKVKLFNEKEYDAKIVGTDPKTDLAVIKIKGASGLAAARLGDSDKIEVGDWVLAVGSPFGLEQTVSHGIISAKGRVIGQGPYDDFLQTDAPINPGNSGGPLVNLKGEVVGINAAIQTHSGGSEGVGFAIPINLARTVYEALSNKGKVVRGWLGVSIQELTPPLAKNFGMDKDAKGVVVAEVLKGGPAEKSGFRDGDVVVEFDGKAVATAHALQRVVAETSVGRDVPVKVWRNKEWKTFQVKIGEMKDAMESDGRDEGEDTKQGPGLGLRVRVLEPEEADRVKEHWGLAVVEVEPGSPAEEGGIQAGDILLEMDKARLNDLKDFTRLARKVRPGQTVVIRLSRDGRALYVSVEIPKK
jgi:serine protease Do